MKACSVPFQTLRWRGGRGEPLARCGVGGMRWGSDGTNGERSHPPVLWNAPASRSRRNADPSVIGLPYSLGRLFLGRFELLMKARGFPDFSRGFVELEQALAGFLDAAITRDGP
jgi:hypothetical protein